MQKSAGPRGIKLKIKLVLDLPTRQTLTDERWRRTTPRLNTQWYQLFTDFIVRPHLLRASKSSPPKALIAESETIQEIERLLQTLLKDLSVEVQITEVASWESSDDGVALSLDQLAHSLRTRAEQNTVSVSHFKQETGEITKTLYVGLASTPAPSFPQLSDLLWARADVNAIVVRRPLAFYTQHPSAITEATARLILRGIAESIAIAPVCDGGWGGADRDELMGLLMSSIPQYRTSSQLPRSIVQDPTLRGAQVPTNSEFRSEGSLEKPWHFTKLKWSPQSKKLLDIYRQSRPEDPLSRSCERFDTLQTNCPSMSSALKRTSSSLCLSDQQRLVDRANRGLLSGIKLSRYFNTARGIIAYNEEQFELSYKICSEVAEHYPSLLASKYAGLAADQLGDLENAALYLRAYLSSHPHNVESLSRLAKVLGQQGKDREAVAMLRRLVDEGRERLGEEYHRILYNLGVAEAQLKRPHQAIEAWSKITEEADLYESAQELIKSLRDADK